MEARVDPMFQHAIEAGHLPGVAACVLDVKGNVLFSKGYGRTLHHNKASAPVTPDSPCMIFSCTKLITCIAALQLIERGELHINDLVEKYLSAMRETQLLQGFDQQGRPILTELRKKPSILHLFTHTSGFGYDMFDAKTRRWRQALGQETSQYVVRSSRQEYETPFVFEPGARYEYSTSIDWLGLVIEQITGKRLDQYCEKHIFAPLGLQMTGSQLSAEQETRLMIVHDKDKYGNLSPDWDLRLAKHPEVMPGGHFAYSTCHEFSQILLTLLNRGTHPILGAKILEPDTVENYIFRDLIPDVGCLNTGIGVIPSLLETTSNEAEFLPGVSKGWSAGLMINNEDAENGRRAGSGAWAGVANSYFWIDPKSGLLGFLVSAVMPFMDKEILHLADALERAAYGRPMANSPGEDGSNFSGGERGSQ